jgi:hypothetical protein
MYAYNVSSIIPVNVRTKKGTKSGVAKPSLSSLRGRAGRVPCVATDPSHGSVNNVLINKYGV